VASPFARQVASYKCFVGNIKIQFDLLARCAESDCLYVYVDILGDEIKQRSYDMKEGRASWFMEI
jgi:hypothetical protein